MLTATDRLKENYSIDIGRNKHTYCRHCVDELKEMNPERVDIATYDGTERDVICAIIQKAISSAEPSNEIIPSMAFISVNIYHGY